MYIYVAVEEAQSYYENGPGGRVKARLEQASGERCLVVPYQELNLAAVRDLQPRAVVMGGFGGHFQQRKIEWFWGMDEVLHEATDLPILAICGSHQLLAFSFNHDLHQLPMLEDEPIRKLEREEDLPRRARQSPTVDLSQYYLADGFFPVWRVQDDPLFAGLPEVMIMRCSHYCEVKRVPPGFDVIARSKHSPVEGLRHRTRPLWGIQFHAEAYEDPWLDGRAVLRNFASAVRRHWQAHNL